MPSLFLPCQGIQSRSEIQRQKYEKKYKQVNIEHKTPLSYLQQNDSLLSKPTLEIIDIKPTSFALEEYQYSTEIETSKENKMTEEIKTIKENEAIKNFQAEVIEHNTLYQPTLEIMDIKPTSFTFEEPQYSKEIETSRENEITEEVEENEAIKKLQADQILLSLDTTLEKKVKSVPVLVMCGDRKSSFYLKLISDSHVTSVTGIPNFHTLNIIINLVNKFHKSNEVQNVISLNDKVVLTLMKLKHNFSYGTLSKVFNVSPVACRRIFQSIIQELAYVFKSIIYFPAKELIVENFPACFQESLSKVRLILDCVKILIQKPSCKCRTVTICSHFNTNHTVKYMTGFTPAGLICFVSKGYSGHISERTMFEQSKVITNLIPFADAVMVSEEFIIEDIVQNHNVELIKSPSTEIRNQLSSEETMLSSEEMMIYKVVEAWVPLERSIKKIKSFKILQNKLPCSLVPFCDDIFNTICGINNLSSPIIMNKLS